MDLRFSTKMVCANVVVGMAPERTVTAAIVVDRWPLMRLGMRKAVHDGGLQVAGEAPDLADALELQRRCGAGLLVLGDVAGVGATSLRRAVDVAVVVALVGQATRDQLVELLGLGVLGVGLRSASPGDLADLVRRTVAGERALAPALLPALVDRNGEGSGAVAGTGPAGGLAGEPTARERLTARERKVLVALAAGSSNSEIAAQLFVSPATVKTHLAHIYAKLEVSGRHEALSRAVALGLVH